MLHNAMGLVHRKNNLIRQCERIVFSFFFFPENFLFLKLSSCLNKNKALNTVSKINAAFLDREANNFVSGNHPDELSACFINILSGLIWSSKFWLLINVCGWAQSSAEVKDNKLVNPSEMGHLVTTEGM